MGLLDELLELVLPQACAGCGSAPGLLCAGCRGRLRGPVWPAWPSPAPSGLPTPYAAVPYDGAVRNMIVAHKESGRMGLARHLGAALALSVMSAMRAPDQGPPSVIGPVTPGGSTPGGSTPGEFNPGEFNPGGFTPGGFTPGGFNPSREVLLVPVPSARAAVRARGHDPALRIAIAAVRELRARRLRVRCLDVLRQTRGVADQSTLTATERLANLAGALTASRPASVRGRRLLIVDDVITTGATLAEAARALRAAGAHVLAVAVVAATIRDRDHLHPLHPRS